MRWISRKGNASPCTGCVSMIKMDLIKVQIQMTLLLLVCLRRYLQVHDHMGSFIYNIYVWLMLWLALALHRIHCCPKMTETCMHDLHRNP